jgi:hypothetical protein
MAPTRSCNTLRFEKPPALVFLGTKKPNSSLNEQPNEFVARCQALRSVETFIVSS